MAYLAWDSATTYPVASVVSYGGTLWEAIQVSTNEIPARGSLFWGIVGLGSALGVSSVSGSGPGLAVSGVTAVTVQNTGVVGLVAGTGVTITDLSGTATITVLDAPAYTAGNGITFVGTTIDNNLAGLTTPTPSTVSISADPSANYTVGFTSNSPYTAGAGISTAGNVATNTGVVTATPGLGFFNSGSATTPAFAYNYPRGTGTLVVNTSFFTSIDQPGSNAYIDLTQGQQIGSGSAIWSTSAAIQLSFICDAYTSSGGPNVNIGLRAAGNLSAASGLPAFQYAQQTNVDLAGTNFTLPVITASFTLVNGIHYNVGGLVDTFLVFQGYINYQAGTFWSWYYSYGSIQLLALF